MELKKRGMFFTTDAILALVIIFFVVILVVPQNQKLRYETSVNADILDTLSLLKVSEIINRSEIQAFNSTSGLITDTDKTLLEQIGELYVLNKSQAREFTSLLLGNLEIKDNIGIWIGDDLIYSINNTSIETARDIDVAKKLISGINDGNSNSTSAFSSTARLVSGARTNYFYFGGYVGEGNITVRVYTNGTIRSAEMELAISDDFDLYINGFYNGTFSGSSSDFIPVSYTISDLSKFQSGENLIEFRGDNLHISGGYLKVTTQNDVQFGQDVKYYPPGVEGLINVYDGLYVPSDLSSINISLHANSTVSPILITIGNVTIFRNTTNDEETITIDNSTIGALVDYSTMTGKTTPIRIGLDNVTYEGISQLIDAFSVVDLSGSMACSVNIQYQNCHTSSSNCNSCGGVWQGPINDAKDATKIFIDLILNTTGNKVGLVGYEQTAKNPDFHELSSDNESLNEIIDDEWDADGGTCICCGIEKATQGFIDSLSKQGVGLSGTIQSRVSQGDNDAEERLSNGNVNTGDNELDMIYSGSYNQEIGMKFKNIDIPNGATITNAYIDFEADGTDSGTTHLTFSAEDTDNAPDFTATNFDITSRTKTSAKITWSNVPSWNTNGNYQTPDISSVVQEIIDRPGWTSGNSIAILVNGSGRRQAESYNGESNNAPLLVIDYTTIPSTCGNSIIEGAEQCDDGNSNNNDDCTNGCTIATCFDGVIWDEGSGSEQCDNGGICSGDNMTSCLMESDCSIVGGSCQPQIEDGCDSSCQIEDRFKSLVVMSDGEATYGCSGTTNIAQSKSEAIQEAVDACNNYGIQTIAISFGDDADSSTMLSIGTSHSCNGAYYNASTDDLEEVYTQIANDIQTEFIGQTISVEGVYSKLFPDSYISLGYTQPQNPNGLVFSLESQFINNYSGSFTLPDDSSLIKTEVTSYSGSRWTSKVFANGAKVYNISEYGNTYTELGDPFKVGIPNSEILSSGTNVINLTTSSGPANDSLPGSQYNKIVYTVVKNVSEFSGVSPLKEGCYWQIEFEDNSIVDIPVPIDSPIENICNYTSSTYPPGIYNIDDANQVAVFNLLKEIDIDSDGKVDVYFTDQDLDITLTSINGIPWDFTKEIQARRWI